VLEVIIDYTITLGNIVEIGSILAGGLAVLYTLKGDVKALKDGAVALKFDLEKMQSEITKLGEILINLADIRGDIKVLNNRITLTETDIRELRRGHGWIQGTQGVDREYK
jgi:hypothetical protein